MNPITRYEMYLANMNGESIDIPEPITRVEMYLARLCGMNNDIPKPITREEMFLAYLCGEEITPPEAITRLEMFMASAAGIGDKPTPITRKEMLWDGVEAVAVKDVTVSGNPIAFITDIRRALKKAEVAFSPVQDLHGYANPWPAGGGVNKFNPSDLRKSKAIFGNAQVGQPAALSNSSVTNTYVNIAYLTVGIWTISYAMNGTPLSTNLRGGYICDSDGIVLQRGITTWVSTATTLQIKVTVAGYLWASFDKNTINLQIESGKSASPYAPYSNICPISGWTGANVYHSGADTSDATAYSITFPSAAGTVYGGTLDVTNGVMTVDRAQIASYAGETLPSIWISDRDVYSAGATPTTGAQVVYKLATPIEYDIDAVEIKSLYGDNVMWSDGDNLEVTYVKKATT